MKKRFILIGLFFAACLHSGLLMAQTCNGYVLYKEDFGGNSASDPAMGSPLPDGVTNYIFTTEQPPEDGYYQISKQVKGHTNTWFQADHDHDGNGYMMIINASYNPGLFYQTRIDNLCQGSSFYFSAWVANLMKAGAPGPLDPNLRFVIRNIADSSIIKDTTTGTLSRYSVFTWVQYGILFNLPAGQSSVLLQIFNNQTGGNGNDLVLDDITFSLCGPSIQIQTAGLYPQSQDVCEGQPVSLSAILGNGYKSPQVQWQFGTDTITWNNLNGETGTSVAFNSVQSSDSGWYRILVAENGNISLPNCRIASAPTPIHVWLPQPFTVTSEAAVCEGDTLQLSVPAGLAYQWEGPNGFTSDQQVISFPDVTSDKAGTYNVIRTTRGGCYTQAQKMISVQKNDLIVSIASDSVFCQGTQVTLDAANIGATYQWNTGAQTPTIMVDTPGNYQVIVNKGVCQKTDSVSVREILKPVVNLGNDTTICYGEPYTLNVSYPDVTNYLWQDGTTVPIYTVSQSGTYSVLLSNQCGNATGVIHIKTEECANELLFPTAFSPNGDGMNDYFKAKKLLQITNYELRIFDRWGRLVFQTNDPDRGWDGTNHGRFLPVGTYVWAAHYIRVKDQTPISQHGTITLIR